MFTTEMLIFIRSNEIVFIICFQKICESRIVLIFTSWRMNSIVFMYDQVEVGLKES